MKIKVLLNYGESMKNSINISIDADLLETAKKQIPNISGFVEECLRNYLGVGNHLIPTSKMKELIDTISKSQLELHLMNEKNKIVEANKNNAKDEINYAWKQLYTEYRDTRIINPDKLSHGAEVLKVSSEELTDIIEVCYAYARDDNIDTTDWETVYEKYGYGDN